MIHPAGGMTTARVALLLMLVGCGPGSNAADAAPDIDNGTCGSMLRFTGEYVDWDNDTTFCGLPGSVFTVRGSGTTVTLNAPNGRVDLCVPDQAVTLIDITPPRTIPGCKPDPMMNLVYSLPGLAVANKAVVLAGGFWSGRTFVQGRETHDTAKAQVYVHVVGPARAVSLDAGHTHGPIQAVVTSTWAPGDTGHEVFIPDVDPAGGSATLSIAGDAIGAGSIPLVANTMTTLTVITH
jgi:hypothetical protein